MKTKQEISSSRALHLSANLHFMSNQLRHNKKKRYAKKEIESLRRNFDEFVSNLPNYSRK
jgi:hypothetical protein